MSWIKGLLLNFQFFTSIPVPVSLPMDQLHLKRAIQTFPLLGLIQGIIYAGVLFGILQWTPFSPLAAAFFVWLACIVITGGIHLDGWIDTSDAFFSYRDKEQRLEIMKDPRTGAFGVLSVIVLLAAKFLFIYEITLMAQQYTFYLIVLIPFFAKMCMGVLLLEIPGAKKEGLGNLFKEAAVRKDLQIYVLFLIVIGAVAFFISHIVFIVLLSFLFGAFLSLFIIRGKIIKTFGGMTGDVLGASSEGIELLLWLMLWLLHYFVMV